MSFDRAALDRDAVFKAFNYEPTPFQHEIHSDRTKHRVVACGIRFGKTFMASHEALAELMVPDTRGWILVPNYALGDPVFRTIFWKAKTDLPKGSVRASSERDRYLKTSWNSEVYVKSAENPDALIGESLDFLIVDEAARVTSEAYEQARGRLIDRDGWSLSISTPAGRNWFEHAWRLGQRDDEPNYKSWSAPTSANPYLKPEVIEEEKRHRSERSIRQDLMAEFVDDDGLVFRNVDACATYEYVRAGLEPESAVPYIVGWDVGRYQDYSVVIVANARTRQVVHIDRFQGEWHRQTARVAEMAKRYNRASIIMDATGEGDAVYAILNEANRSQNFARRVEPFRMYDAKLKRDIVETLASALEKGEITYPKFAPLLHELRSYEFDKTPSGNLRFRAPDNEHDDCVMALALVAHKLARTRSTTSFRMG